MDQRGKSMHYPESPKVTVSQWAWGVVEQESYCVPWAEVKPLSCYREVREVKNLVKKINVLKGILYMGLSKKTTCLRGGTAERRKINFGRNVYHCLWRRPQAKIIFLSSSILNIKKTRKSVISYYINLILLYIMQEIYFLPVLAESSALFHHGPLKCHNAPVKLGLYKFCIVLWLFIQ